MEENVQAYRVKYEEASAEFENYKKEAEKKLEKKVAIVKETAQNQLNEVTSSIKSNYETEISNMKSEFEEKSKLIQNETRTECDLQMSALESKLRSKLDELNGQLLTSEESSRQHEQKSNELEANLKEVSAKLMAATAEVEAMTAAAKDGENRLSQQMQEALQQQRKTPRKACPTLNDATTEGLNTLASKSLKTVNEGLPFTSRNEFIIDSLKKTNNLSSDIEASTMMTNAKRSKRLQLDEDNSSTGSSVSSLRRSSRRRSSVNRLSYL